MGTHMKTTIEISDGLLRQAKALAEKQGTTIRALVEAGLRSVLKEQRMRARFVLRDASVSGNGLRPEFRQERWDDVRDAIYEGRGT
jgi:hypothetical protein